MDASSYLDEVIARLKSDGVDWAKQQADQVLGRKPEFGAEGSPSKRALQFEKLEKLRGTGKKRIDWIWYRNLNLPQPLSNDEHVELAGHAEVGLFAEEALSKAPRSLLSDLEEKELLYLQNRGRRAFSKLLLHNLRLVFNWARPYRDIVPVDEVQDAFQAGVLGLIRGLQGWDHKRGFTLSTYVTSNIRQSIQRWRMNETLVVRVPVHVWSELSQKGYLRRQADDEPVELDKAEPLPEGDDEIPAESTLAAAVRAYNLESLETLGRGSQDPLTSLDIEDFQFHVTQRNLHYLVDLLPGREAAVLRMRYGLLDGEPKTLDEIGNSYGLTRERIRQILETSEGHIALFLLCEEYPNPDLFRNLVGSDKAQPGFWEWLPSAYSSPHLAAKAAGNLKTLKSLMKHVPRAETSLA